MLFHNLWDIKTVVWLAMIKERKQCTHNRQMHIIREISLKGKSLVPHTQTYLKAATATAVVKIVLLVSFPPNPPPILFTRTTTRFEGTPNALAANS